MSQALLIGYRVVAGRAHDTFVLRQAAEQCCRLLLSAKVHASLWEVTEVNGLEMLRQIKPRPVKRVTA